MFGFIGNIGPWELMLILLVAVIVVGPGKLPEVARGMGKAMGEFKRATSGVKKEFSDMMNTDMNQTNPVENKMPEPQEYKVDMDNLNEEYPDEQPKED
ncbi:MAG: twin-arginine translocase TatA/TatE family subunit [Syntrophomonadaceae bacterium]|nr:twin-arginine translocase TatA/TatE family subunit [Syntrophomonadaceae bacterium]